jgi:hypothetical protein
MISALSSRSILLSTHPVLTHLSLRSSRNATNQVWTPYKTTGKIIVSYILIFTFLDKRPIAVTAHSKAWIDFVLSNTGIVRSNPTQDMDVWVSSLCVCQGRMVHGCGGSIASLLKNETKYFCQFSISKKYFILQNMNQSKNIYFI